jgi:MSHA biogenesis protein MshJ
MQITIEQYWQRFQALNGREQLMVAGAIIAVLWGIWDSLLLSPLLASRQSAETQIAALQEQLNAQQQALDMLQQKHGFNPNDEKRVQLARLDQALDGLKKQLLSGDKKFVKPEQMAVALSDMLKQNGNLRLVKLETLPVTPFAVSDSQKPWVYRHGLTLTFQGDFFSSVDYLKTLENLPWRIQWDNIDYQVKDYPFAETRIQVYTLSFEQDWLGA